jgi:serine phosphatase RsbU (regulator of sigma subunit)
MEHNGLEVQIAVAKIGKYATSESGDTMEMIERPQGGLSLVLADGQRSGRGAKRISNLVARKTLSLLAEGVRDGAAARAAHDYLYAFRGGKVQSTLNIVSIDLVSRTVVLSRNSNCPVIMIHEGEITALDAPSCPVGIYQYTKPNITEVPIVPSLCILVFTDGLLFAGQRCGQQLDVTSFFVEQYEQNLGQDAQTLADSLLGEAVSLEEGRPTDDISILVTNIVPANSGDRPRQVRRMNVTFPI